MGLTQVLQNIALNSVNRRRYPWDEVPPTDPGMSPPQTGPNIPIDPGMGTPQNQGPATPALGSIDDLESRTDNRPRLQAPKQFDLGSIDTSQPIPTPHADELQKQADAIPATGITPPQNWKQALLQTALKVLPVALAGRFGGGLPAAAGAAKGEQLAQQTLANQELQRRKDLLGQAEQERQREFQVGEDLRKFQLEMPFKQAQLDYEQKRGDYYDAMANRNQNPVTKEVVGSDGKPHLMQYNPQSGKFDIDQGIAFHAPTAELSPDKQTFDSLIKQGLTPEQAYQRMHAKDKGSEGSWSLVEDTDGNPELFNNKTGEAKPAPNIQKPGTFAKGIGAARDAKQYADLYMQSGTFTGPGDEAMMEKYFELAKPSTGFRMTKDQMAMLQNARSWMGSAEGIAYHAKTGQWFSPGQRQQIYDTMKTLEQAKEANAPGRNKGGKRSYDDPLGIR